MADKQRSEVEAPLQTRAHLSSYLYRPLYKQQ